MKYKDYLILPAIVMFMLYASCAFISKSETVAGNTPDATVNPDEIVWGYDENGLGEYWFANGMRGTECFFVLQGKSGANEICFFNGTKRKTDLASKAVCYSVEDGHMICSSDCRDYDLVFVDEMTAYDSESGIYYRRGDYRQIYDSIISGKFVNVDNSNDYYVFQKSGKSTEFFGEKAFPGRWRLVTSASMCVYDNRSEQEYSFNLIYDNSGVVCGFTFDGIKYYLERN